MWGMKRTFLSRVATCNNTKFSNDEPWGFYLQYNSCMSEILIAIYTGEIYVLTRLRNKPISISVHIVSI